MGNLHSEFFMRETQQTKEHAMTTKLPPPENYVEDLQSYSSRQAMILRNSLHVKFYGSLKLQPPIVTNPSEP